MQSRSLRRDTILFTTASIAILFCAAAVLAQSTGFTYQGRLTDGGSAANGNYDMQFALWDSLSGGNQVGSTQTLNAVAVGNGIFTVTLDFGANAFPGASRFLEISARPAGAGSFTLLTPRQPITSTPYAVRSLNAAFADNVPAATVINATTQYNLNGTRILAGGGFSLLAGENAGLNSTGAQNAFFGGSAGAANMTGSFNGFFGSRAGLSNTTGQGNSFFGESSGRANTIGSNNSFYGINSGRVATGGLNTFIGAEADFINISPSGNRNTLLGANAKVLTGGQFSPDNATAIGANAQVDQANSLVLGSINGVNGATADTKVGIGTTAPAVRLHVVGTTGLMGDVGIGTTTPSARLSVVATGDGAKVLHLGTERSWVFKQFATGAETALELTANDPNNNNKNFLINTQGFVGIGTTSPTATLSVNGGANKPGGGSWGVFSDERLKNIRGRFTPGLRAVMQLQPLRYEYKRDNALNLKSEGEHIGFSAQAAQKIIPEAVTSTEQGYLLVNNDPILWTMLNAIKEQQQQIEQQQKQIAGLKRLVCRTHRRVAACQ